MFTTGVLSDQHVFPGCLLSSQAADFLNGFKHAAATGACSTSLAGSILNHRRYRLETLPYALDWQDG